MAEPSRLASPQDEASIAALLKIAENAGEALSVLRQHEFPPQTGLVGHHLHILEVDGAVADLALRVADGGPAPGRRVVDLDLIVLLADAPVGGVFVIPTALESGGRNGRHAGIGCAGCSSPRYRGRSGRQPGGLPRGF